MSTAFTPRRLDSQLVFPRLRSHTREAVLLEMAEGIRAAGVIADALELAERLAKRERDGCTGLGGGIAIPHCRVKDLPAIVLSVGISHSGIDFGAADGIPITLLFLLLSPMDSPALHLQALAWVSRLVRAPGLAEELRQADSEGVVLEALRRAEAAASATATA